MPEILQDRRGLLWWGNRGKKMHNVKVTEKRHQRCQQTDPADRKDLSSMCSVLA